MPLATHARRCAEPAGGQITQTAGEYELHCGRTRPLHPTCHTTEEPVSGQRLAARPFQNHEGSIYLFKTMG